MNLRKMGNTFRKRITGRQQDGSKRNHHRQQIELHDQCQRNQAQHDKQYQRLTRTHSTRGDRAIVRTSDLRVDVTIGVVVDHTASRTHNNHAGNKHP